MSEKSSPPQNPSWKAMQGMNDGHGPYVTKPHEPSLRLERDAAFKVKPPVPAGEDIVSLMKGTLKRVRAEYTPVQMLQVHAQADKELRMPFNIPNQVMELAYHNDKHNFSGYDANGQPIKSEPVSPEVPYVSSKDLFAESVDKRIAEANPNWDVLTPEEKEELEWYLHKVKNMMAFGPGEYKRYDELRKKVGLPD